MTDPVGGTPPPPSQGSWQAPPPPAPGMPGNFQQAQVEVGPAPGVSYADLVTRVIALVIDGVILVIPYIVLAILLSIAGGVGSFVGSLLWAGLSAVYFVWTWTTMRATYGQKFMKLETVNAADGATLTQPQAIRRWVFLFGPNALAAILTNLPILGLAILGSLMGLVAFVYAIYLAYSASQSPKRQGFHDLQAGTVVVKRG
jgi:uncharacterized RDD family membrane protein YckC